MFINYNVFAQLLIALRPSKALFWFIDVYTSGSCTYVLIFLSVAGARASPYSRRIKKLDRRRLRNKFTQQIPVGKSRHEKNRSRTSDFHVLITESISIARKHAPRSKKYLRDQTTGHVRVLLSFFPFLLSFYIKSDNLLLFANYSVILATQRNACSFVLVLHLASFTSFSLLSVLRFNVLASSLQCYFYFPFSHLLFRYLLWVSYLLPLPFHLTFISNPYATSLHFPPHTLSHTHFPSLSVSNGSSFSHGLSFLPLNHAQTLSLSASSVAHQCLPILSTLLFFSVLSAFSSIVADPSQVFSGKRSRAWHPLRTRDLLINMATSGGQAARHKETSRVEPLSTVYTAHGAFKAALFLASDVSSIHLFRFPPVCHLSLCYMLTFVSSTIAPRTCYSGHGIGLFICTCTLVRIQKLMQFIQSSEPRSIH